MIRIITEENIKSLFNKREKDCNKGNFGYVGVMGGCPAYSGAVKLANLSMAALRSGCGVSRLIVPSSIAGSVAPYLLESTLYEFPCDSNGFMRFDNINNATIIGAFTKLKSLSVGMGWGMSENYPEILKYILKELNLNLIIDADGLNTLGSMICNQNDDNDIADVLKESKCNIVMTPHLMEFSRLSGYSIAEIKENKVDLACEFANKYHVILLLKGAETIVTDGNEVVICDRGTPGMATAGSGDVLSGILTGLLGYIDVSVDSVAAGTYINGMAGELAAEKFTEISMTAGDTVSMIPEVMKTILTE